MRASVRGDGQTSEFQVKVYFTNDEDATLIQSLAGHYEFEPISEENGVVVFREHNIGVPGRLLDADGRTLYKDVGRISWEIAVRLNGPGPADDEVLSFELLHVGGPHPEFDSDFALFCEVFVEHLG